MWQVGAENGFLREAVKVNDTKRGGVAFHESLLRLEQWPAYTALPATIAS